MTEKDPPRLTGLEETVAHQEATIGELSDQLAEQWKTIERLTRRIDELEEKVENLSFAAATAAAPSGDEPPPHY